MNIHKTHDRRGCIARLVWEFLPPFNFTLALKEPESLQSLRKIYRPQRLKIV